MPDPMTASTPAIAGPLALEHVTIQLPGVTLIDSLNLAIAPGEVVTIMGPSGSGKSTLLAFLTGTLGASFNASGRVMLGGRDITALAPQVRRLGILFQDDLLFPHLSVGENLAFGLSDAIKGRAARWERIRQALADGGLAGFERRDPATLSGGQRARVALLRTLLSEPLALLLDEPFNKLDAQLRDEFRRFVFDHVATDRLPTLLVTHDRADAEAARGRVITL